GLRYQLRVLGQLAALVGVFGENLSGPTNQPGGGLVSCARDDIEIDQQFVAGQPAGGPCLVDEFNVEQLGHDVIGGIGGSPIDVCGKDVPGGHSAFVVHRLAGFGTHLRVGLVADEFLVVLGDAEQHADDLHGHLRAEVGDEVDVSRSDQRIQRLRAEVADLRLQRCDLAAGEHPGQQLAVNVVDRRVFHDEQAGRDVEVSLDQL